MSKDQPETITINGRTYKTKDICRRTNVKVVNLRAKNKRPIAKSPEDYLKGNLKYTVEERIYQMDAPWQDVQARWGLNDRSAKMIKYQAKYIIKYLRDNGALEQKYLDIIDERNLL